MREEQRTTTYLGMGESDINVHDQWACESMGPIQNHEKEKLLPTDRAIVMARRMLYEAANSLQPDTEPPAINASQQRARAAGVLLPHEQKPQEWAKDHLADAAGKQVYSV